ncbi:MAG TPA: MFS transporter [Vineibacter sp.]|nr:MFS transporter [Vineibacter sp.]
MTDARRPALVAAVYLGTFIAALDVSIVSVALPSIQTALHTDIAGLQWVVGAYALCLSAFMLSAGPIGDRYGRKRSWLLGVAVFMVGSAICAAAATLTVLIAGCAIQGIAGAFLIPGALSILRQAFPDPVQRAHVIGGWSSFSAISLIVGPILGGILVDTAGWPSIFLINLPIGVVTIGLGLWGIRETAHPDHAAFDPAGQALSVLWLGTLTYGLISAGQHGWTARGTVVALAASVAAFVAFMLIEARVRRPLLPLMLFGNARFAVTNLASFVLGFSGYSSLFFFSLFLQQAQGWSATEAGWRMAPQFAAMALVASGFGWLAARYDVRILMIAGYGMVGGAMLVMSLFVPATPYPVIAMLFTALGIGMGLAVPATSAAVMMAVPRERSGMASATMNALRQAGMTLGIALLGTLMSARAMTLLTTGLEAAGVADAGAMAVTAVTRHQVPVGSGVDVTAFNAMLGQAFAGGFHVAMAYAGLLGLTAAALLVAVRSPNAPTQR